MSRLIPIASALALIFGASVCLWAQPPEDPASAGQAKDQPPAEAKTEEPADKEAESKEEDKTPTAEEMLRKLQQKEPARKAIPAASIEEQQVGAKQGRSAQAMLPEGHHVNRRPGRLVREGQWWTFVFESDHPDHPEPRLKLLPNWTLEQMVRYTESTAGVVFIVSGEVTAYMGENYLLTRVAMRQTNMDNLSK